MTYNATAPDTLVERARELVGRVWGRATTLLLAIGIAIQPVLQNVDPSILSPEVKAAILWIGIAVAVLRVVAPPAPAIRIGKHDEVHVDEHLGLVSVIKAGDVDKGVVTKPAGMTMKQAIKRGA